MQISISLLSALALVGVFTVVSATMKLITYTVHYLKFKTIPKTLEEEKISILTSEREIHLKKIVSLEGEVEEMTRSILNKLTS